MARVKNSVVTRARRKKVLEKAEGYFGSKHRLFKTAQEQVMHSERYAFRDRRQKKREFRKLWITRINAECRVNDISYSKFINGLSKNGIEINRKMLSELAISDKEAFANLVKIAKGQTKVEQKPVVKENKEKQEKTTSQDLTALTVTELKQLAKSKKIEGYTSMKKQELIDALK